MACMSSATDHNNPGDHTVATHCPLSQIVLPFQWFVFNNVKSFKLFFLKSSLDVFGIYILIAKRGSCLVS